MLLQYNAEVVSSSSLCIRFNLGVCLVLDALHLRRKTNNDRNPSQRDAHCPGSLQPQHVRLQYT